jgi:flagellar biosynthesis/type III secretory pathway protein FliH
MNEQKRRLTEACRTLDTAAMALNDSRCRLFTDHKEDIAKLAVEIARKVLMQQVLNGAYDIETIVTKALEHVPSCEGVTVQVNPEDLDQCRQAQDVAESPLDGVTFVADPMIGRAECRVESPKGVIQSLINEHLEQISKALLQKE